jgi:aryl-alcohol dehydrogenase-like predicted oxidoreductase
LAYCDRRGSAKILRNWCIAHRRHLADSMAAVTSRYAPSAIQRAEALKGIICEANPEWKASGSLSQLAIRALRTTSGISAVLVGMHRPAYVRDVLQELRWQRTEKSRDQGWAKIKAKVATRLHFPGGEQKGAA